GLLALDQTLRRVRVHKEPLQNQQRVLEAAFHLLGVQTLICVPPDGQVPVHIQGKAFLAPIDCIQLAGLLAKDPANHGGGPIIHNAVDTQPWALSFPDISTLLAFPIADSEAAGWVIALNKCKKDDPAGPRAALPFRRSDAALLTPFVALLRLHFSASTCYQDLKELRVGLARW